MGRRFNEVTEENQTSSYKVQGSGAGGDVRIVAGGKEWATGNLGHDPPEDEAVGRRTISVKKSKSVITVSGLYLTIRSARRLGRRQESPGLEVMRIVNEPTRPRWLRPR